MKMNKLKQILDCFSEDALENATNEAENEVIRKKVHELSLAEI
jgi:hypothetical protein